MYFSCHLLCYGGQGVFQLSLALLWGAGCSSVVTCSVMRGRVYFSCHLLCYEVAGCSSVVTCSVMRGRVYFSCHLLCYEVAGCISVVTCSVHMMLSLKNDDSSLCYNVIITNKKIND